ncbi:MAG: MFS transporter [Eubacteriales bacterium]|nr:MFS transporter [Eubacteriales bacterium]
MKDTVDSMPYRVYRSRWLILVLLIPVIVSSEIFWLTFAPIASFAQEYYHTSSLGINLFSMSYMLMYILFTMPASYVIEKFGFKRSVMIGAGMTAVFGAARFLFAENFTIVLLSQFLLAAGQPFLINISTKVPANWFPVGERATASGFLVMAQYIGFIVPMIASPILIERFDIKTMLGIYAAVAVISAALALCAREKPQIPPGPEAPKESMGFANMRKLFMNKNFLPVLILSFISMGLFNTLMTMIEQIFMPKGLTSIDAGIIGAVFVISGIVGAVMLPLISDKLRTRIPFFIIGVSLIGILCTGLTFLLGYGLLIAISALLGFIIMGMAPILFQHGAEMAYPVQEGASFGSIMLMGQVSGIIFVLLFDTILGVSGTTVWPMMVLIVLALLQIPLAARMKESAIFKTGQISKEV